MSTTTAADREVAGITMGLPPTPHQHVNYDGRPNSAPQQKSGRFGTKPRSKSIGHEPSGNGLETPYDSPLSFSSNSSNSRGGRKRKSKRILKKRSKFTRKRKSYKK
jgi:hypothetical protein